MKHDVTAAMPPLMSPGGRLEIHRVPAWTDNLIWLVRCVETNVTAVVDGPEAGPTLEYCEAHGLRPTILLNTHTHPDHIGINKDLEKRGLLDGLHVVGSKIPKVPIPGIDRPVEAGDAVKIGAVEGQVLLTPGHQDGHITFAFDGALFCGDTLFAGGCGYMFDGPPSVFHASLQQLAAQPDESLVCCAHEYTQDNLLFAWMVEPGNGALAERIKQVWSMRARGECTVPSTIGVERATNPFLRVDQPEIVESLARLAPDATQDTPEARFGALRGLKDRRFHKALDVSTLPI